MGLPDTVHGNHGMGCITSQNISISSLHLVYLPEIDRKALLEQSDICIAKISFVGLFTKNSAYSLRTIGVIISYC